MLKSWSHFWVELLINSLSNRIILLDDFNKLRFRSSYYNCTNYDDDV